MYIKMLGRQRPQSWKELKAGGLNISVCSFGYESMYVYVYICIYNFVLCIYVHICKSVYSDVSQGWVHVCAHAYAA